MRARLASKSPPGLLRAGLLDKNLVVRSLYELGRGLFLVSSVAAAFLSGGIGHLSHLGIAGSAITAGFLGHNRLGCNFGLFPSHFARSINGNVLSSGFGGGGIGGSGGGSSLGRAAGALFGQHCLLIGVVTVGTGLGPTDNQLAAHERLVMKHFDGALGIVKMAHVDKSVAF